MGEITTGAVLGYMIDALQRMKHTPDEIREIVWQLKAGLDDMTIEEAEKVYTASPY